MFSHRLVSYIIQHAAIYKVPLDPRLILAHFLLQIAYYCVLYHASVNSLDQIAAPVSDPPANRILHRAYFLHVHNRGRVSISTIWRDFVISIDSAIVWFSPSRDVSSIYRLQILSFPRSAIKITSDIISYQIS